MRQTGSVYWRFSRKRRKNQQESSRDNYLNWASIVKGGSCSAGCSEILKRICASRCGILGSVCADACAAVFAPMICPQICDTIFS
ncbi:hypothetical protein E3E27_06705 [Thermococcus sp. MV11]|nr:hypothetical protein [Thermococcus sp. MV11]